MARTLHLVAEQPDFVQLFGKNGQLVGMHPMPARQVISPGEPILTILHANQRPVARLMKWAFLPDWVKDPGDFTSISSARMETVEKKPSFRNAIRYRRCLVPATGVWQFPKRGAEACQTPQLLTHPDGKLFAIAAIWETWMGPFGEEMDTVAILTAPAKGDLAKTCDRVPLVIRPADFDLWLDVLSGRFHEARPLLQPVTRDKLWIKDLDRMMQEQTKGQSQTKGTARSPEEDRIPLPGELGSDDEETVKGGKRGKPRQLKLF
ncbi:SOS response-associated peptidase [uncultured Cohaesibacter sp.]|uniref:SOS response-associated peptidase n=1 Tax=uncultured Cohaesibacter sp. TaxID=1002546 RepID=UPI00292F0C4F|nr:SOS response-associated peptidase [uncultured Cohaesibacter sp.]